MKTLDKDGKSTTSSAVDGGKYPDPRHGANPASQDQTAKGEPATDQAVDELARKLWEQNGRPAGSAEQFRKAAEEQLKDSVLGKSAVAQANAAAGSVQK